MTKKRMTGSKKQEGIKFMKWKYIIITHPMQYIQNILSKSVFTGYSIFKYIARFPKIFSLCQVQCKWLVRAPLT